MCVWVCVVCEINYTYIYLMYEIIISIIHETLYVLSILNGLMCVYYVCEDICTTV